ncbi:hypothetical protein [Imperialibacter roseus]|uniref:Uncharacterized protein n=1 Tax=Imperialibacter roseus TaxID=1324217 RepID=A0ABZ0IW01_9BACT|nr:hypothetical protein [Imperialibacter roseus]WOK09228.1 hypothetical protein RT717_11325 [Imperialibacter roseus]
MKTFFPIVLLFLTVHLAVGQDDGAKTEKFGNATIDKYIASVTEFASKQKGLSSTLAKLDGDIDKASKEEDESAIDGLLSRFKDLESSYKSLDTDSKRLSTDGATASKASSQCGTKAPKCAEGVKKATALLDGSMKAIVTDKTKMTGLKAKAEAAKKKFGGSGE